MNVSPSRSPVLRRGHYAGLALMLLGLILYGSFVPFDYEEVRVEEAKARFEALLSQGMGRPSRSDFVANVLLFVPLGFVLMGTLCVDRPWGWGLGGALLVLPFCGALTLAIEFGQQWFPARTVAFSDVVGEALGGAVGVLGWLAVGQCVTDWVRRLWETDRRSALPARLLLAYLTLLVLIHVIPLDLTLGPADLYHKYKEGRIQPAPFVLGAETTWAAAQKTVWNFTYFLPVGWLLAQQASSRWQRRGSGWRVLGLGFLVAGGIEFMQLFVLSRFCTTTDILTGALAIWAGWRVATLARGPLQLRWPLRLMLATGWVSLLVLTNWQPFDFTPDTAFASRRLQDLTFVPFADTYLGDYLNAYEQMVLKVLQFAPLGALLTTTGGPGPMVGFVMAVIPAALLAAILESGQLFLPSRFPSFTDVLVEAGGAGLGFLLTRRFALVPV